jgi:hypothetical protein
MIKLFSLLLFVCVLTQVSFADYEGNRRIIPVQTFKERFTMGELIAISAAYAEDSYIRTAVSKLASVNIVDLDSDLIKRDVAYLRSKSILSDDRARDILK